MQWFQAPTLTHLLQALAQAQPFQDSALTQTTNAPTIATASPSKQVSKQAITSPIGDPITPHNIRSWSRPAHKVRWQMNLARLLDKSAASTVRWMLSLLLSRLFCPTPFSHLIRTGFWDMRKFSWGCVSSNLRSWFVAVLSLDFQQILF